MKTAQELDALDPLGHLRGAFQVPEGMVYLDGNSLGPMPQTAVSYTHLTLPTKA